MKGHIYLVLTHRGVDRTCKTADFTLKPGERAVRLEVEVPDEAFAPVSVPTLKMKLPAEALIREFSVVAETSTDAEEREVTFWTGIDAADAEKRHYNEPCDDQFCPIHGKPKGK